MQRQFADKGFEVDSTFDLARVLRVPGTLNRKVKAKPVEARIIAESEVRYALERMAHGMDASLRAEQAS